MAIHDSEDPGTQMRAALYLRTTLLGQHPEAQVAALRDIAQQNRYQVVEEFADYGAAGVRARRPALDRSTGS